MNPRARRIVWQDRGAALLLFCATAAVVVWQNSRVGVLWDLSYVLETSHRLALGDIPYRDFPFPHAPLTFLVQAAIIKLAGHVFWHHIAYCAVAGGLATVLTWRILLNVLRERITSARILAWLLSLPLVVLGIYCIFPHPFYDPDCTLTVLLCIRLLQRLETKSSTVRAFLVGMTLVIPLFVKQNIGLAFLVSVLGGLVLLIIAEAWQRLPVRKHVLVIAGAVAGLSLAVLLIHLTAGIGNYWHWTIQFAGERRSPARGEMLSIYADRSLWWSIPILFAGTLLVWLSSRRQSRILTSLSAAVIAAPFVWPAIYLLRDQDASERADRLLALWPMLMVIAFAAAILSIRRRQGLARVLPFILIATAHGAFLSQQLWGSTYGIWPLFVILLASTLTALVSLTRQSSSWTTLLPATIATISLLVAGSFYLRSNERLDYANISEGEMAKPALPQLKGLSIRGPWSPNFEELVRYTEREIPPGDAVLVLPGEDLFYYTTGRRPQFPVLLFDRTTNPYSPEEIVTLCRDRNIRWVVVKRDLQLDDELVDADKERLEELLGEIFDQVESLNNYEIYRRNEESEENDGPESDAAPGPVRRQIRVVSHKPL